ncbi:uncharacterized protein LOC131051078 isoform X1 [Cryptomeria japonica]|uniref:uncharacterized protein LOC131051078 isoform X1 n=1 Tax=Cryptomeria japonica TaxID=3369 RepID=UPI0027DA4434|nr:uncharacterized protein LOC131051078 isoform X1 [Cryptomeria japonica]
MQGSEFNRAPTEDDKRIAYQRGYTVVVDRLRELSGHTQYSGAFVTQPANRETPPAHEGPDVHPNSREHVVSGDQVEHDLGTHHQERDVPQSDDLEGVQHVEVEARQNDVAPSEDPASLQFLHPQYRTRHTSRSRAESRTTTEGENDEETDVPLSLFIA